MFKIKKFSMIAIGALLVTLALGLVAFAPIDNVSAAAPEDGFNHGRRPGGFRPAGPGGDQALADELGISVEELQSAHQVVQVAALEGAVADGKLTQEQADQIVASDFSGPRGRFTPRGGEADTLLAEVLGISVDDLQAARQRVQVAAIDQALADGKITAEQVAMMEAHQALQNYMQKDEMIAKALGITVDELDAAKGDSQRIPDLMEELGIEQEDFEANMQTLREEMLEQAVQDGVITQEQADQMLENDFRGGRGPGGRGFPAGKDRFERPEGFPGRPGNSETDGTDFQRPDRPVNQG